MSSIVSLTMLTRRRFSAISEENFLLSTFQISAMWKFQRRDYREGEITVDYIKDMRQLCRRAFPTEPVEKRDARLAEQLLVNIPEGRLSRRLDNLIGRPSDEVVQELRTEGPVLDVGAGKPKQVSRGFLSNIMSFYVPNSTTTGSLGLTFSSLTKGRSIFIRFSYG